MQSLFLPVQNFGVKRPKSWNPESLGLAANLPHFPWGNSRYCTFLWRTDTKIMINIDKPWQFKVPIFRQNGFHQAAVVQNPPLRPWFSMVFHGFPWFSNVLFLWGKHLTFLGKPPGLGSTWIFLDLKEANSSGRPFSPAATLSFSTLG